jgi:cell division protein FtsB
VSEGKEPPISLSETSENAEKLEKFLKSLGLFTTARQWAVVLTIGGAAWLAGYSYGNHGVEHAVIAGKADLEDRNDKLRQENTSLRSQVAKLEPEAEDRTKPATLGLAPIDIGLPSLDSAIIDSTTFEDVEKRYILHQAANAEKTQIQRDNFFVPLAGKRFEWAAFVYEVWRQSDEMLAVTIVDAPDSATRTALVELQCYFEAKSQGSELSKLIRGQKITLAGVMSPHGFLAKCKLVKVFEPPKGPPALGSPYTDLGPPPPPIPSITP